MTGGTHAAVGAATALTVASITNTAGDTEQKLMIACAGALAALLADIDLKQSKSAQYFKRTMAAFIVIGLVTVVVGVKYGVHYTTTKPLQFWIGAILSVVLCILGYRSPHREKTHSFAMCLAFSVAFWLMEGSITLYFLIGYLSHLVIDFPNEKGECLLWPYKKRFCLKMCSSDGIVNSCLGAMGTLIIIALFLR